MTRRGCCSCLQVKGGPYAALLAPTLWQDVAHEFSKQACSLMGQVCGGGDEACSLMGGVCVCGGL